MNEFNLDILYKGFDDPNFLNDLKKLAALCEQFKSFSEQLGEPNQKETLIKILNINEELVDIANDLGAFCGLRESVNTFDKDATNYDNRISQLLSAITKANTKMEKYIIDCVDLNTYIKEDEFLKNHEYYLNAIVKNGKHLLEEQVEEAISKMNMNAGLAWEKQWQYLTSSVEIEFDGKNYGLAELRNLAYDSNPRVRKEAYEAELKGYEKIKDAVAFSLNAIKGQVNTLCEMRNYESPLAQALDASDMKKETLDAMLAAMEEYLPTFRQYLKRKAKLLGHTSGLPFYDLFAVVAKQEDKKYTVEEAKTYLVSNFKKFSDELATMVQKSFEDEWIDFYPRKGKVGGAFCLNLPKYKQSRVLTNYDGYFTDIVTLAHELGHAFHGQKISVHTPLNRGYCMPLAETASTFNENLIMNTAIKEAQGEEKLALMESQLQDITQIILDIYSRFLFEKEVFDRRKDEFLFPDQLEEIMMNAQKEAYGDGLDENYLHPYMWVCKSHYYSSGLSFYNFPYTFGGLFARGLYALYQEQGTSFAKKYNEMLKATTITSVEDCAMVMGIDLTKKEFWEKSLASYCEVVHDFLETTK